MYIDSIPAAVIDRSSARTAIGSSGAVAWDDADNWHVWVPKPGMADVADRELNRQGFRTFAPKQVTRITKLKGGGIETNSVDLFPGYRFVQFDTDAGNWVCVHYTFGVRRLMLGLNLRPATVPSIVMLDLLASPVSYAASLRPPPTVKVGETVGVTSGPWVGMRGLVQASSAQRVVILMSLFGGNTPVAVPTAQVERV